MNALFYFVGCVIVCALCFAGGYCLGYEKAAAESIKIQTKIYSILLRMATFFEKLEIERETKK